MVTEDAICKISEGPLAGAKLTCHIPPPALIYRNSLASLLNEKGVSSRTYYYCQHSLVSSLYQRDLHPEQRGSTRLETNGGCRAWRFGKLVVQVEATLALLN